MAVRFISYELEQVMELENIVANTVYIKARESKLFKSYFSVASWLLLMFEAASYDQSLVLSSSENTLRK